MVWPLATGKGAGHLVQEGLHRAQLERVGSSFLVGVRTGRSWGVCEGLWSGGWGNQGRLSTLGTEVHHNPPVTLGTGGPWEVGLKHAELWGKGGALVAGTHTGCWGVPWVLG